MPRERLLIQPNLVEVRSDAVAELHYAPGKGTFLALTAVGAGLVAGMAAFGIHEIDANKNKTLAAPTLPATPAPLAEPFEFPRR